jgi:hypothetical protein
MQHEITLVPVPAVSTVCDGAIDGFRVEGDLSSVGQFLAWSSAGIVFWLERSGACHAIAGPCFARAKLIAGAPYVEFVRSVDGVDVMEMRVPSVEILAMSPMGDRVEDYRDLIAQSRDERTFH